MNSDTNGQHIRANNRSAAKASGARALGLGLVLLLGLCAPFIGAGAVLCSYAWRDEGMTASAHERDPGIG